MFSPAGGTSTSVSVDRRAAPDRRRAELHAGGPAAVRADLGTEPARRPQHAQRPALGGGLGRLPRRSPAGSTRSSAAVGSNWRARWCSPLDRRLPRLERLDPQRQADRRARLLPFGVIGAILTAIYSVGATVYVPHLFSTYATRYGVIGAVFAMISALFCVMVVIVGSAALGREVDDELARIRARRAPARRRGPPGMGQGARRGAIPLDGRGRADQPPPRTQSTTGPLSRPIQLGASSSLPARTTQRKPRMLGGAHSSAS